MAQSDTKQDTLSGRELKLLEAMVSGASLADAAVLAGISRRQAYRVAEAPLFVKELKRRQSDVLDLVARRLSALSLAAVDALASVIEDPGQRGAGNKRLAAAAVLAVLHEWLEVREFEARLSALEEKSKRGE